MFDMRRILATLFVFTLVVGTVNAQNTPFKFAADPFDGEQSASDAKTKTSAPVKGERSYESLDIDGDSLRQKKAAFRAEQRQLRIASRNWNGISASRPMIMQNPYMTNSAPMWGGRGWTAPYYYSSWHGTTVWR